MKRRIFVVVTMLVAAIGASVLPAQAATKTVTAIGTTFVPPVVTIAPGDHLVLNNKDVLPHTLTSTDGKFDTGQIGAGQSGAVNGVDQLKKGTYQFVCLLHPWMRGALVVGTAAPAVPTPDFGSVSTGRAVVTPTSITTFKGAMYAASYATGAVSKLALLPGGLLGPPASYASGFTDPLGIAFAPDGTLFVADSHASSTPGRTTDGRVWAVAPGGGSKSIVIDGLPNGRHNTNGLAVHNGRLFITNGSSTDNGNPDSAGAPGEVPDRTGALLSVPVGARGLTSNSAEVAVHAIGMRNVYDVAFRTGTDEAWLSMNGPDTFDPWGEDLLLKTDTAAAAPDDFGFPGCLYSSTATPNPEQNPAVGDPCDASQKLPEALLGLHVSADGMTFDAANQYVYIALFGNFYGNNIVGHKVIRLPVDASGHVGAPQDVMVGGLPLDVTATSAGVYMADFATGQITLIRTLN